MTNVKPYLFFARYSAIEYIFLLPKIIRTSLITFALKFQPKI